MTKIYSRYKRKITLLLRRPHVVAAATAVGTLLVVGLIWWGWQTYRHQQRIRNDALKPLKLTNLTYCNGEKLDLVVPSSNKPLPVIVYVHGGGWRYGSKAGGGVGGIVPAAQKSFAVAAINYRLSPRVPFPAQINDVFCAVRFLRAHADLFHIDAAHVGVIGHSAGGHLAALAAVASDQPEFTIGAYGDQSSKIQAAVSLSGILDLTAADLNPKTQENIAILMGESTDKLGASPLTYLDAYDPPLLVVHGTKDIMAPITQAESFAQIAIDRHANVQYLPIKNATHNLTPSLTSLPKTQHWQQDTLKFLHAHLDQ